jgi:hypothetical protein
MVLALVVAALGVSAIPAAGQGKPATSGQFAPYTPPRTADGHPDLSGIWQAFTTANIDIEDHVAREGPFPALMGVYGAEPAGLSIVQGGGEIPYQPWALEQKKKNFASRMKATPPHPDIAPSGDPELKCFLPGIPRAMYMPFPFQIVQQSDFMLVTHEYKGATRIIRMNWKEDAPVENTFWMGWSRGRWEGDTLVVEVTGQVDQTWFDRAGNFHSEAIRVVERFTPVSPYHMMYEATIEDPKVFTRAWTIRFPLYRRMETNAQLLEFVCVPFAEELMYGDLVKKTDSSSR